MIATTQAERVFSHTPLHRRELRETFWINPRQIQESGQGWVKKLGDGRYEVCCKGQHVNLKNRNGRIYPTPTWARHLLPHAYFMEKISGRRCVGQVEHPQTGRSSMDKGAIVVTKAWIDEDTGILWIVFETMSTPHGKIVAAYLDDGVGFGVSSRGNGSTMNNGEADVVQEDFDPITWDTVLDESTPGAEVPAEMAMQAEARARLGAWAKDEIERERKKILAEAHGSESAASLMARTQTEQMLVECYGGVCTLKPAESSCACGGECDPCRTQLVETMSGQGGVEPPKGYNELLLATPDGAGHYRAYDDGQSRYDVWLMVHNLKPEKIATGLQTMKDAKKAAENHYQMISPGRGESPATPAPASLPSSAPSAVGVLSGAGSTGGKPVEIHVHVGESTVKEAEIDPKTSSFEGSTVYLRHFSSEEQAKKAAKALDKAGFLGVEYVEADGCISIHTGYDSPSQAADHVRRVLTQVGIELAESIIKRGSPAQNEGVEEIEEEARQAKDASDDIEVPTHSWVGGGMVKTAKHESVGPMESMPMEMMAAMLAGYMAEMGRSSMGEQGGDPSQGYPNDYAGPSQGVGTPNGQGYPTYTSGVPSASGGYPGHPGHSPQDYPGMEGYTSEIRQSRDHAHGAGYYEDEIPGQGWPGDKGHQPNVGPTSGQMVGPNTNPLNMTVPGFRRAYEAGQAMARHMNGNYGNAPQMVPNQDDLAMMFGYGFEAMSHSPPGGPEGRPVDRDNPNDNADPDPHAQVESGYLNGYQPTLDDPEDIDLDLDVNDPYLDIGAADSGPSPYDQGSTDTIDGYSEAVIDTLAEQNDLPGYSSTTQQEEATMPGTVLQPAYAFRSDNRTSGGFVKYYFNESHRMVEVREFAKDGKLSNRWGFVTPGSGIKVEAATARPDPKSLPESVHATIRKAQAALGNDRAMRQVFAEQAGQAAPNSAAKVPDQPQGVYRPDQLKPDSTGGKSAEQAKKDAGGGAPSGKPVSSTTQSESEDDDEDDEKKTKSESKDDEEDDDKSESRLEPKQVKALRDDIAERDERIKVLEAEKDQLTKIVEQMTVLQTKKDVQHKLESILRDHPELKRLKSRLEVCESVEALAKEASEFLKAIHEANGFRPQLPGLNEDKKPDPKPAASKGATGRDTAGKNTASSTQTTGAPTVGALDEDVDALPALGAVNGSTQTNESTFSRVRDYRRRHGRG